MDGSGGRDSWWNLQASGLFLLVAIYINYSQERLYINRFHVGGIIYIRKIV